MTSTSRFGRRRLYLLRHGHVDYFQEGLEDPRIVHLTETGRAQAGAARDALKGVSFDIAAFSGLPRTQQTAEIVLEGRDSAPLISVPDLEELKSGWLRANSREELAARLAFCFDGAENDGARFLPDGETFRDAEKRIIRGMTSLIQDHSWKTALVVAHEGVNRIVLGWACGGGLQTIGSFEQDLACINVIDLDITPSETDGAPQIERCVIKAVNVTAYDYIKAGLPRTSLEHLFDVDFGGARPLSSSPLAALANAD